ncbi:hypothetical protein GOBAR_AA00396 [Gossypium barbadense]|uniref:Uncharacterized protein n=1 Tax=Gossypium barbadense TaxID=3634 RepID=A0A2P5YX78_GOSBA|nr:hypothetical protein GOBAR_AA00396 [Gossypium barbadense]
MEGIRSHISKRICRRAPPLPTVSLGTTGGTFSNTPGKIHQHRLMLRLDHSRTVQGIDSHPITEILTCHPSPHRDRAVREYRRRAWRMGTYSTSLILSPLPFAIRQSDIGREFFPSPLCNSPGAILQSPQHCSTSIFPHPHQSGVPTGHLDYAPYEDGRATTWI